MAYNPQYTEIAFKDSGSGSEQGELLNASVLLDFFGQIELTVLEDYPNHELELDSESDNLAESTDFEQEDFDSLCEENEEELVALMYEVSEVFDIDSEDLALGVINLLRSRSSVVQYT